MRYRDSDHYAPPEYVPEPIVDEDAEYEKARDREDAAKLNAEERRIACGCLSLFVLQMGRDLRKGGLTEEGAAKYRQDMRTAGFAIAKLMGGAQ